jgi:hypothetical protein
VRATRPGLLRALGVAGAVAWTGLALLHRDAWPWVGLVALGASLAVAIALRPITSLVPRALLAVPRPAFVAVCALAAAGISAWVLHRTLRDQPLSIDAGTYLYQAHALAHGRFGMPVPVPAQAFDDRFLLEGPDERLYGIFPPGWPLAIVPLAWLGRPMWIGPALAAALIVAQASLGRTLARLASARAAADANANDANADLGELATRVSLLLSLASIGRALETADLLSHAFVALMACVALTAALGMGERPRGRGALIGVCVGWALAARLLDGVVLGGAVLGVLAWTTAGRRAVAWAALGAAPLLLLLLVEQHAATGAWLTPTQTVYFARSDWPPTCHRLGFGPDVGCTVEHPGPVSRLGGHGFGPRQGLAVMRERAGSLGEELFGFAPLALLAFVPLVAAVSAADAVAIAFVLALTLAYGLFYYGNSLFFGARHLFPAAPFFWVLVARGALALPHRARGWLDARHVRGAAVVAVLAVAVVASRAPWTARPTDAADFQSARSDLRRTMDEHDLDRGILKTRDYTAFAAAYDPAWGGDDRVLAMEDGSGLLELRRAHPELPVFLLLANDEVGRLYATRAPPGVLVELERAWPAFVRPRGLAARQMTQEGASGGNVLLVFHAAPDGEVAIPFDVAVAGHYAVRVDGFGGPEQGDYELRLDGEPLATWHGYRPAPAPLRTDPAPRDLASGRHALTARCIGKDAASGGFDARLDAFVGDAVGAVGK